LNPRPRFINVAGGLVVTFGLGASMVYAHGYVEEVDHQAIAPDLQHTHEVPYPAPVVEHHLTAMSGTAAATINSYF